MVRAGLSVHEAILNAGEALANRLGVPPTACWGMSPFGGDTSEPVWNTTNMRVFLTAGQESSNVQTSFRLAYELPTVTRVAVRLVASSTYVNLSTLPRSM